jgi:FAD binding domain
MDAIKLTTLKDNTAIISDEVLAAFKSAFSGRVLAPGNDGYDEARRVWNSLIDRQPGLIAQARGLADVVQAVTFARTHGLLVSVRGGGHNVSGSAVCDGGMVIDLREMRAVRVDRKTMTVHVQGGGPASRCGSGDAGLRSRHDDRQRIRHRYCWTDAVWWHEQPASQVRPRYRQFGFCRDCHRIW